MKESEKRRLFRMIIPAYPTFNIYSRIAKGTTALGPVCVATAVKEMGQWDVEVIDENNLRRYGPRAALRGADHEYIQKIRPADFVGFYGGLTSTIPRLYEIARFYKNKGVVTIAGGQHFCEETIPEAFSSGIDFVVIGEGEETIKELLCTIINKGNLEKVRGIVYPRDGKPFFTPKREPIRDFNAMPLPDFSLVRYAKMKLYPVGRVRGCVMNCEFCSVKSKPRYATPERLMESISSIMETRPARQFFIVDDLFGQDRDETIRFCNMIHDYQKRIGKPLSIGAQIRLDKAQDKELLRAMRQAGIKSLAIGFESPIKDELQAMNKRLKTDDMIKWAKTFRKFGFVLHGMFIFGYPLEHKNSFIMPIKERIKHFRQFIKKARLDTIQVLLPVPLPGTELRNRLKKDNRLYSSEHIGWEYYDGSFPLFEPDSPLTPEDLQDAGWKIMRKFYEFRYVFAITWDIFSFPLRMLHLNGIKLGWRRWFRSWRNHLIRFGGWITMRIWRIKVEKSDFLARLKMAKNSVRAKSISVPIT